MTGTESNLEFAGGSLLGVGAKWFVRNIRDVYTASHREVRLDLDIKPISKSDAVDIAWVGYLGVLVAWSDRNPNV
jgi:hypothetical protein